MIWILITGLLLIVAAGCAEHFKDLSEEGKLSGYWDKNHPPMFRLFGPLDGLFAWRWVEAWPGSNALELWWRVHWLQGPGWKLLPVWIRKYLSFRDGWHLLKFTSLTLSTLGYILTAWGVFSVWKGWFPEFDSASVWFAHYCALTFLVCRVCFSSPETILRKVRR